MIILHRALLILIMCGCALSPSLHAQSANGDSWEFDKLNVEGGQVVVIPMRHGLDDAATQHLVRALRTAASTEDVRAIVLDIGLLTKATSSNVDLLLAALRETGKNLPIYAFISKRTSGVGTLLCLASDAIFMASGSYIGPAGSRWASSAGADDPSEDDEGLLAEARVRVRGLADDNGHNRELAMALVDPTHILQIGDEIISPEGRLLSMTAREATRVYPELGRPLFAAAMVDNVPAILDVVGITNAELMLPSAEGLVAAEVAELQGSDQPQLTPEAWTFKKLGVTEGTVLVVPLVGPIDKALIIPLRRAFREAKQIEDLKAIVIHMDTPGGQVDLTKEIIDMMREAKQRSPVYVFVDGWGASAGAIISLASNAVFMSPGSNLGSAMPVMGMSAEQPNEDFQEKMMSHLRGMARALAEENGYHPELAEAFIDRSKRVVIGDRVVCEEGELLSLTAVEAAEYYPTLGKPLFASGVVLDVEALMDFVGIEGVTVKEVTLTSVDKLARWITALAPLLMIGFFIGFYTEVNTPGFGVPGVIALTCLGILLFGHYVAGLAGYEDMALIGLGIILLIVELFVIPGFGFVGMIGIGCILTGVVLVMIPNLPKVPKLTDELQRLSSLQPFVEGALLNLAVTLVISVIGFWFLAKYLPRTGPFSKLVLLSNQRADEGYVGVDVSGNEALIGASGLAMTDLRPSGMARIQGRRLDVVSAGDYILKGDYVRITRVNGPRIEVVKAKAPEAAEGNDQRNA